MGKPRIEINYHNIKDPKIKSAVDLALQQTGIEVKDLSNQANARQFVEAFTPIVCEVILKENFFGEFMFQHLVTTKNDIYGTHLIVRGKGLAKVNKVSVCELPTDCSMKLEQTEQFEDRIPINTYEVSDVINEWCLTTTFCSDTGITEYINQIKKDLTTSFMMRIQEIVELDFADKTQYSDDMKIYVDGNDEKAVTKAILKAKNMLMVKNKLNIKKTLTKSSQSNIWGLLNINSKIDYLSVLNCCANGEQRMGSFYDRLQVTDFLDREGEKQSDIVGVIYDADTYVIQHGRSDVYNVQCPNNPIWVKQSLFQKTAHGFISFRPRVIILNRSSEAAKELSEDLTVKELGELQKPLTDVKVKAAIKSKNQKVNIGDVDVSDIEDTKSKAKGKNSYKGEVEVTYTST